MSTPSPVPLWLLLLCFLITGCAALSSKSDESLGNLIVARLEWMDDVARFKQANGLPITDPKREAALLQTMTRQGTESGLSSLAVRGFFSGQMAAAREHQKEWLADPKNAASSTQPLPDLEHTIRPALDAIGRRMIAALAQAQSSADQEAILSDGRQRLTKAGYSKAVTALAMDGLEAGLSR